MSIFLKILYTLVILVNFIIIYLQMPIPTQAKIVKKGSAGPDQFELSIAQALLELENNSDLKAQLRELYITKAKEIELLGKKVCLIGLNKKYQLG